jgi:hypothetical protein
MSQVDPAGVLGRRLIIRGRGPPHHRCAVLPACAPACASPSLAVAVSRTPPSPPTTAGRQPRACMRRGFLSSGARQLTIVWAGI